MQQRPPERCVKTKTNTVGQRRTINSFPSGGPGVFKKCHRASFGLIYEARQRPEMKRVTVDKQLILRRINFHDLLTLGVFRGATSGRENGTGRRFFPPARTISTFATYRAPELFSEFAELSWTQRSAHQDAALASLLN